MALTLGQGAQLAASASFQNRVRMAMMRAAHTVSNETQGTLSSTAWVKRQQLATRILTSPSALLQSFVDSVAADPGSSLPWFPPVKISSSTNANPSVVTTAAAHGLATGDVVEILDHLVNTAIVGTWAVTVLTTTTFSVPQAANGVGGATGTVQKMMSDIDINFTVNSNVATNVFSAIAGLTHEDRNPDVVVAAGLANQPPDMAIAGTQDEMAGFVPFPVPVHPGDAPLVQPAGAGYRCTGCGGAVPDGAWITETVEDGMVVGLLVRHGGVDGPVVHRCGTQASEDVAGG